MAMQGLLSAGELSRGGQAEVVSTAVAIADMLIAELEKPRPDTDPRVPEHAKPERMLGAVDDEAKWKQAHAQSGGAG